MDKTTHISPNRRAKKGAPFSWARWRGNGMVHYRLTEASRIPPRTATAIFIYATERKTIADSLRRLRAAMRE